VPGRAREDSAFPGKRNARGLEAAAPHQEAQPELEEDTMMRLFVFCALLFVFQIAAGSEPKALKHVDVFVSGQDGYSAYRIPAVETAPDGTILAFAEARKYNLSDPGGKGQEIDLVLKRSTDGGRTWSPMTIIEHSGKFWSSANPATCVDRTRGRVWVFYLRCKPGRGTYAARPGTEDVLNLARYSDDNGATWSEPIDLTKVARDFSDSAWRISVPGPGGAIQDRRGRLIVPMWRYAPWNAFVLISEDHGRTWKRSSFVPGAEGANEDQLVELPNGNILIDIRQRKSPHRWVSISSDGGFTWSQARPGQKVTPVCCAIEKLVLKGDKTGNLILWTGPKGPGRKKLVVRISYDGAKSFSRELLISEEPAAYSDLTVLKDGDAAVLWERGNYRFITFTRLSKRFLAGTQ